MGPLPPLDHRPTCSPNKPESPGHTLLTVPLAATVLVTLSREEDSRGQAPNVPGKAPGYAGTLVPGHGPFATKAQQVLQKGSVLTLQKGRTSRWGGHRGVSTRLPSTDLQPGALLGLAHPSGTEAQER